MDTQQTASAPTPGLLFKVLLRFGSALLVLGLIIFLPAGSLAFWNGWLYLAAILLPMLGVLVYLFKRDPGLLEKRIKTREKEKEQKLYIVLSILLFLVAFTLPGLDFRFKWSSVPFWLVILATVIMLAGYALFVLVMRQNSYASRVIEIQNGQKLIDTGLYSVVRHPMYMAASLMYLAMPLVLGSFYAVLPLLLLPLLLGFRIVNEEKVLRAGLPGYEEYTRRVKYRLIPFVW
jgi:protein-S-isoprenylcysteine O-methyltransferase Ste14